MRYLPFLLLLLVSCDNLKWEGYSQTESGLYYKIHKLGDGVRKVVAGDEVYASIVISDQKGKYLYQNNMQSGSVLQVGVGNTSNATISEALSVMHSGDSASFVGLRTNELKSMTNGKLTTWEENYILSIKLNRIQGEDEELLSPDHEMAELAKLKSFLAQPENQGLKPMRNVFVEVLKKGNGIVQSGQQVRIHFIGKFLNGQEFDNTYRRNQTLDFQLGKPDQVIKAFEIALHAVGQGGKVRVVSSSNYAFGHDGSSTGIIPPYTSVAYIIEVVKVN